METEEVIWHFDIGLNEIWGNELWNESVIGMWERNNEAGIKACNFQTLIKQISLSLFLHMLGDQLLYIEKPDA